MDPDTLLRDLRALMELLKHGNSDQAVLDGVVEKFEGLDDWLSRDGHFPRQWMSHVGTRH